MKPSCPACLWTVRRAGSFTHKVPESLGKGTQGGERCQNSEVMVKTAEERMQGDPEEG